MKVLFISRSYPPVVGGIEKQNYEIYESLSKYCDLDLIANRIGKPFLPIFLIYSFIKSLIILRKYDVLLLGDGVLAVVGRALQAFYQVPIVCIIHGLDLTYDNSFYQSLWVSRFIKDLNKLIAVGNETIKQGTQRGIPPSKFVFVPNGVRARGVIGNYTIRDLENITERRIKGKVLLTIGRLVKRKGIVWFIENVMVKLPDDVIYIVAGTGKEKVRLLESIEKHGLETRVIYLGRVSENQKEILYCTADIFVQPNISVEGDMEGFGLVVLEAASYGLPVVASNTEGLKDAIHDGKNGFLIEEGNAEAFKAKIQFLLLEDHKRRQLGLDFRKHVEENFSWEGVAQEYVKVFEQCVNTGQ